MSSIIAYVDDPAVARVLVTALKAHGFHPSESGLDGIPGLPGAISPRGIPIQVPDDEEDDARLLAEDLIREMTAE